MPTHDHCSLLIVDGEPYTRTVLAAVLRQDFQVRTADSGQAAERILARHDADLVLADVRLPDMTGVQLLESLRHRSPRTIRLLMGGYVELEDLVGAINRARVYRFFLKPWRTDELLEGLREAAAAFRLQCENDRLLEGLRQQKLHPEPADPPIIVPGQG